MLTADIWKKIIKQVMVPWKLEKFSKPIMINNTRAHFIRAYKY